jgi:hypothetical protein
LRWVARGIARQAATGRSAELARAARNHARPACRRAPGVGGRASALARTTASSSRSLTAGSATEQKPGPSAEEFRFEPIVSKGSASTGQTHARFPRNVGGAVRLARYASHEKNRSSATCRRGAESCLAAAARPKLSAREKCSRRCASATEPACPPGRAELLLLEGVLARRLVWLSLGPVASKEIDLDLAHEPGAELGVTNA